MSRVDVLRWGWVAVISAGCTTLAGIDEDYVPIGASGTAGTRSNVGAGGDFGGAGGSDGAGGSTGGASGTNGASGSGGSAGIGGSSGTGGTAACPQGEKRCNGECVMPSPANGCGSEPCDACPAPTIEHVEVWCNPAQVPARCDVRCASGFMPDNGRCVPEGTAGTSGTGSTGGSGGTAGGGAGGTAGTAGTTGTGGTGGSGGRCSPNTCPSCPLPDGKIPCCSFSGQCGCGYPVVGAFYCI